MICVHGRPVVYNLREQAGFTQSQIIMRMHCFHFAFTRQKGCLSDFLFEKFRDNKKVALGINLGSLLASTVVTSK